MTIPAGTYNGQDEDILCAAHGNYVTTSSTLDEQVGYDIVKTVMENLDYMATVHDAFKLLSGRRLPDWRSAPARRRPEIF